jgi:hypothetical protein
MPNGQPAQLANLTHFKPGHKTPRYAASVVKSIAECRKVSPEMVEFTIGVVRDPEAPIAIRLKAAELILERALPKRDNSLTAQFALGEGGGLTVRLEIIDAANDRHESETITITPNGSDTHDEPISLSIADDGRDGC